MNGEWFGKMQEIRKQCDYIKKAGEILPVLIPSPHPRWYVAYLALYPVEPLFRDVAPLPTALLLKNLPSLENGKFLIWIWHVVIFENRGINRFFVGKKNSGNG